MLLTTLIMLGFLFTILQIPVERREESTFDQVQVFDEFRSNPENMLQVMNDREMIATVVAPISPYRDGQIEWRNQLWTAACYEDVVFEENDFVYVVGRKELTCIVKKLPRSICPSHHFN